MSSEGWDLSDVPIDEISDRIDADDLNSRAREHSSTDLSERDRCELCLSLNLETRVGSIHPRSPGLSDDYGYRCRCCGHRFDNPERRDYKPALVGMERIERKGLQDQIRD